MAAVAASVALLSQAQADPFAFLSPAIQISAADRQRIESGQAIVNILPAKGHDAAFVAVTLTTMSPERLVQWTSDMERLKSMPPVQRVKKLSAKPTLEEFSSLALPDNDIRDIRSCKPGSCNVKLTPDEIARMRREMQTAGPQWLTRGQQVFREIARERVATYLSGGHEAFALYADGHGEPSRAAAFAGVIANSPFLQNLKPLALQLERPVAAPTGSETFVYWSIEQPGAKAVMTATQTVIVTSAAPASPAVMIAGKQIFATHYTTASLNMTALVRRTAPGAPYYLVVVSRSSIDAIGGFFGAITRKVIEGRMKRDAPGILTAFRQRIEAGPPRG